MDIVVFPLAKNFLTKNIEEFIEILHDVEGEYWRNDHFLTDLPGKFQFSCYAVNENSLCGYIIASLRPDSATVHVHKFMVAGKLRGKGVGAKMMAFFTESVKSGGKKRISLKVGNENHSAIRFYEKHGFEITAGEPEKRLIIMIKQL